ncbi:MAG: class F sortase [Jiangellaceae bacterium]
MERRRRHRPRPPRAISLPALILVVLGSVLLLLSAAGAFTTAPPPASAIPQLTGIARPIGGFTAAEPTDPARHAEPRRLLIDGLALKAEIEPVGVAGDGTLALPAEADAVGWFDASSVPGDTGPAVLVGHVDSADGPAVFAHLGQLRPGDVVAVEDVRGGSVAFAVTSVSTFPKNDFPTDAVYGGSPDAELRLITCGGDYERGRGYPDNVVVAATAIG